MPIRMPIDTLETLGENASKCESRSLFFDRFADPTAGKDERKEWFRLAIKKAACPEKAQSWAAWLSGGGLQLKTEDLLFAQLESRLMINMAGGVMENAGLCLDRFGVPYIPGSAVKGCARRMAVQHLKETREASKTAQEMGPLLADVALIFGWGEEEWSPRQANGRFVSDFAYAIGANFWDEAAAAARRVLPQTGHFAGSIGFLPASVLDSGRTGKVDGLPIELPPLGNLELDVLTCHHRDYYRSADPDAKALDTEEPVPVFFPAVAAGHIFAFAVLPLRFASATLLSRARTWLAEGLATFGLGAKTAAGYGWFEDVSLPIRQTLAVLRRELEEKECQRTAQAERETARANLQPDPELSEILRRMKEPDLRGQINPFATEERFWTQKDERVQLTLLHFLCVSAPDMFAADRAKPGSKIAKAITNLSAKYPHIAPAKP